MTDTTTDPSANGAGIPTVENGWTIQWLDYTWHSTETSAQQLCAVAETLGIWDWSIARPDSGPRQLVTWIAVLWAAETDQPLLEAMQLVMSQPLSAVVNALTAGA